jgi:hypothetical protein
MKKQSRTPRQIQCNHVFGKWKILPARGTTRFFWQRLCRECGYMEQHIRGKDEPG